LQIFTAKPYVENAYQNHLKQKSYAEAVDPERVSILDEQRARAFAAREAALLKEADERKQQLKDLQKKRESESKSLKPIEPGQYLLVCNVRLYLFIAL